ncbi:MAG TPA: tripartite tricarboxylate transporter substrate binding protein [Candidatus Latescibacteria bacterium]|nr:tripartite tricarboxylate transporter substrate binding protein [Candidatus Latescibacterota bacterium]
MAVALFCLSLTTILIPAAPAEEFPVRPINMIVPWPPGMSVDLIVRAITQHASKTLGQPVVVLNKPGAASSVALVQLMNEKPDGHAIGHITGSSIIGQYLGKVPYNIGTDFTPIVRYIGYSTIGMVVRADAPWKTLNEMVAYAKANPGKVKYSTAGAGSTNHIIMEALSKESGAQWVHVPSKGPNEAVAGLLGGHFDAVADAPNWKSHVLAGRLKLLATFGKERSQAFPDTPTLLDLGYKTSAHVYAGFFGPKGVPEPVVEKLHQAFKSAMEQDDFKKACKQFDIDPAYAPPATLAADFKDMDAFFGKFVAETGMKR